MIKMEHPVKAANIAMLEIVANRLGDLICDVVFVGGCTTSLLIDDPGAPDVRITQDVDCIVDVLSLNEHHQLEKKLREKGFKQSISEDMICRWRIENIILDVMPVKENILGFGNIWYEPAIKNSTSIQLPSGKDISVVTAPYFLATKLEAFETRGINDYVISHDIEDIIAVIDGTKNIETIIKGADDKIKKHLSIRFREMLNDMRFHDVLAGHLNYSTATNERVKVVLSRMKFISELIK